MGTAVSVVVIADIIGALAVIALVGIPFLFIFAILSIPAFIPILGLFYLPIYLILSFILGAGAGLFGTIGVAFLSIAFSGVGFVIGVPVAIVAGILASEIFT